MENIKNLINNGLIKIDTNVIIGTTKEYSLFNILNSNREVSQNNLNNIKKSILGNGYCKCNEVVVDEMWNIIDGQHTFIACQELDVEVRFKMIEGLTIKDIISLNSNQKNWTSIDFIKSYAYRGYKPYKLLLETIEKNKDISMSCLMILMFDKRSNKLLKNIQQGTLKINDDMIDRFYKRVFNYRNLLIRYKNRFTKKTVDDVRFILELLDNDFMCRMLENVFKRDKDFIVNLSSKEVNQIKVIADKISSTF